MKLSMSNLDIMVCAGELKNTIDFRVDNVYELDGRVVLRLRSETGERRDLLMEPGRRFNLTDRPYRAPRKPSSFAMLLRKHLDNARLSAVEQPDFERILELRFSGAEDRLLVLELFSRGNLILCDPHRRIIQPYRTEIWRHRAVRAGEVYAYPPRRGADPRDLDVKGLRRALEGAPDVVRGLAINLGLGGALAEELCARALIQKNRGPAELSDQELEAILRSARDMLAQTPAPRIVYEDGKPVDVLPFEFRIHLGMRAKPFSSFNEAMDEYFSTLAVISAAERRRKLLERGIAALWRRREVQQSRFAELYEKSVEEKRGADLLGIHHAQVDEALGRLDELRRRKGWEGALAAVQEAKEAGETWATIIRRVEPRTGVVEVELAGQPVALDLRLSAFENASQLYERYKRAAEKAARAKEALEETSKELERLLSIGMPEVEVTPPPKRRKARWFERYRWFISSDGLLVITGRDARSNAEVVEKHMEPGDRYLHADITGAPHVVVKAGGREVPETTIFEAAQFAAMHSRAWREGLGSLDVYWAMPEQVSRRAPSGSYLPKGSYMIRGERRYLKVPVRAAVGAIMIDGEEIVTCGPPSAMRKHSRVVLEVSPGDLGKSELAREIQAKLRDSGIEASAEEVERALPPGRGEIRR